MSSAELERQNTEPLSDEVLNSFKMACNNLYKYGFNARLKIPLFHKLFTSDKELIRNKCTYEEGATHQSSGRIGAIGIDDPAACLEGEVWLPMESTDPVTSRIMRHDIEMSAVFRRSETNHDMGMTFTRTYVNSRDGKIFALYMNPSRRLKLYGVRNIDESRAKNEVLPYMQSLENQLADRHPEAAKQI